MSCAICLLLICIICLYLLACLYLYFFQSKIVYQPQDELVQRDSALNIAHQEVFFPSQNGNKLHAWHVAGRQEKETILICHGNAGSVRDRAELVQMLNDDGYSVFVFDYQGYGQSQGTPSEQNTYQDVQAAWNYLKHELKLAEQNIIVLAQSLGGPIGAYLASKVKPKFLMMVSAKSYDSGWTGVLSSGF